jgi:hypothetical protein
MITCFVQHKGDNTWSDMSLTRDKECVLRLEKLYDIRRYVIGTQMTAVHMRNALTPPKQLRTIPSIAMFHYAQQSMSLMSKAFLLYFY